MNVIYENILVEVVKPEETKGLIIPDEDKVKERKGIIVRYGESVPDSLRTIFDNKPLIEYKEYYDGSSITIEGKEFIVMNYKDILIIL